ncbi:hypothetical protein Ami103574_08400 [Aminipila butyrica]|uniref:Uncharacterized protein n=1 Tax=Aminipila butyrica TaxID=433296 RepID=A0A858BTT5_9FIRM|nr:SpaA isopeptide-forming pilin-related protein [Aminipila butyrica]QIB69343.1 hypothetical protein Ami103574_08400 [Aminipila butyrica]
MRRRERNPAAPIAFTLVLLLLFSLIPPPIAYADMSGKDVTNIVTVTASKVSQGGEEITDGVLDYTKDIVISYSLAFPVLGDNPSNTDPSTYVVGGDGCTMPLPNNLVLSNTAAQEAKQGSETVGNVTFGGTKAAIIFTNIVNYEEADPRENFSANFNATLKLDESLIKDEGGTYTVTILDKDYTIVVPAKPVTINGNKSGTVDLANKVVNWKVKVSAVQGSTGLSMNGYTFEDELNTSDKAYIPGSFKIGKIDDRDAASQVADSSVYDSNTKKLSYAFTDDTYTGDNYIFFQTAILDSMLYTTNQQNISNTATITTGSSIVAKELSGKAGFKMSWITKSGKVVDGSQGSDTEYKPENRRIQWEITANPNFAGINGATIADQLPEGLEYVDGSATVQYRTTSSAAWSTVATSAAVVSATNPLIFNLGNDLSGKEVRILFETKVISTDESSEIKNFTNAASLKGTGISAPGGLKSDGVTVGIGMKPISKSAGSSYDKADHKIHWTVNVDTKKQTYGGNLRVMELLVYANSAFTTSGIEIESPEGATGLTTITNLDVSKLTASYNQRYVTNSFIGSGLKVTVHTIKDSSGKAVADVLVITQADESALDSAKAHNFTYDTLITNPDIYASNNGGTLKNTATLFSDSSVITSAEAQKTVSSDMLKKSVLNGGFDYIDKSATFRIEVNNNGLTDATRDETTVDGTALGNLKVTDTLPAGWEFKEISGSAFILKNNSGNVISDYSSILTYEGITKGTDSTPEAMTFIFKKLDKPYWIEVKAGPKEVLLNDYFAENLTSTAWNSVAMTNEHYSSSSNPTDTAKVTIISKILSKVYGKDIPTKGALTWTVNYKPYEMEHLGEYITDKLPAGLDLRLNAQGNLDLANGNITVTKLTLKQDGTYEDGEALTQGALATYIAYDNTKRILTFTLPDTHQAYRLMYVTDITGNPGTNLTNKVSLYGKDIMAEEEEQSYVVAQADADATFLRGGLIKISKKDISSKLLTGAVFTLYAKDTMKIIKEGIYDAQGLIQLRTITPGEYILKETKAPTGYKLTEKEWAVSIVTDSATGKVITSIDGNTDGNALKTLDVVNFQEGTVGNLNITKTVTGSEGEQDKEFEFTLNLGDNSTYDYQKSDGTSGKIHNGEKFTLKGGQSINIMNITKDISYSVSETDYADAGYVTSATNATGSIQVDQTVQVAFTNSKNSAGLTIGKTVAGNKGDQEKSFDFTLHLTNSAVNVATRPFQYDKYDGTDKIGDGTIVNGGTVSLKHGETITIADIPAGTAYGVTEKDYRADGYLTTAVGENGTITDETKSYTASFTNTRDIGQLMISKTVTGNQGDKNKEFNFTLSLMNTSLDVAVKLFDYVKSDSATGNTTNGSIASGGIVTLAHGQTITIADIPAGTDYTVAEEDYTAVGYKTTATGDHGTIVIDGNTAAFINDNHKSSGGGGGGGTTTPGGVTPEKPSTTPGGITTDEAITTTKEAITTPEAVVPEIIPGSIKIIKVDGDNTSDTLAGAVFVLLNENRQVVRTLTTDGNGEALFDGLDVGSKYFLYERTAPNGYKASEKVYSFHLSEKSGKTALEIQFKNYRNDSVNISEIEDDDIPLGWIIEEEDIPLAQLIDEGVPTGALDDTPKTGREFMAMELMMSLMILSAIGALLTEAVRRKKAKIINK